MRIGADALAARRAAWQALHMDGSPVEIADGLAAAAAATTGPVDLGQGPVAALRSAYVAGLRVLEDLYRWDAAVQAAEQDGGRFLAAAHRNAEIALQMLEAEDPSHGPLRTVLETMRDLTDPKDIDAARSRMGQVALPIQALEDPPDRRFPGVPEEDEAPEPRVVCLLRLGERPITGPVLVDPQRAYDLEVEARVLDWPDWADRLNVRFLSRWQGTAADVQDVALERPAEGAGGVWRAVAQGGVVVHATPAARDRPLMFTTEAELEGEGRRESVEVLGYSELALHCYDPAVAYVTGSEVIDRRVYEVLVEVNGSDAPEGERRAFGDLFQTLANEAQIIVADGIFRAGEHVREADFQQRLLERTQSVLGAANVRTGTEVGGGQMDIVYLDTITAELKVEREVPATLDRAALYLGQPAHYAQAGGHQLSILCILDVSPRAAPPGVLANGIGLLRPRLAGLEDPQFPSLAGVIVISAGLPLPSEWAGRRVAIQEGGSSGPS
jgi:hypothetical protein